MRLAIRENGSADALVLAAGFWERLVAWRAALLRVLGPAGWVMLALLFMAVVVALMRAGGRADSSEL